MNIQEWLDAHVESRLLPPPGSLVNFVSSDMSGQDLYVPQTAFENAVESLFGASIKIQNKRGLRLKIDLSAADAGSIILEGLSKYLNATVEIADPK